MFHLSLMDIGNFNTNLKGFLAAQQKNLLKEIKDLVREFIEGLDLGGFTNGLYASVNKKN